MKDYFNLANSSQLYVWGFFILFIIFIQAILFIRLAWKEGKRIGLNSKKMLSGLRAGIISAIVPSIAIVLTFMAMIPVLGIPVPWIRLSVIGSGPYELLAAGIGAESMGVSGLGGDGYTAQVFANSVWIMTIGAMWSSLIVFFFLKKIKKGYQRIEKRDAQWMKIISNAAFFGVISVFIAAPITKGGLPLLTLISGAIIMSICALLVVKCKMTKLKEFALAISMIGAMFSAILFS
ncbi:MAG: DUF5058 family protein [Halanaerobiales bacterium]|nr:DUF5058 family protein [Halanaerobiales bacterium]